MSNTAKSGTTAELQYYVYIQNDWRGPYPLIQIKTMLRQKDITEETYLYEPQHQTQMMIKDVIKGGGQSSVTRAAVQHMVGNEDARTQDRIDHAIGAIQQLRQACMALPQLSGAAREQSLNDLHHDRGTIQEGFAAARTRIADLRTLAMQLDKAASEVATRRQDPRLTALLNGLRESTSHAAADEILPAAEKVVAQMVHAAEHAPDDDPFSAYETAPISASGDGKGSGLIESARFELNHLQDDLSSIKSAYAKLQDTYAKEKDHARRLLVQLKEQLESEQKSHEGDIAELRALAAEIHDLACSVGLPDEDAALAQQVRQLATELQNTVATSLVPVAEAVLNSMVNRLGGQHQELRRQIAELTQSRSDLLAARSEMSLLRQRDEQLQADKTRLQKQLDEARVAASKIDQSARLREHQLRSTIAAMQVTKELHQEVLEDIQAQLKQAQDRVVAMESELASARDELKGTRSSFEIREVELQASLTQLSEERTKLEERRAQLSGNLQSAEAELALARAKADQSAEDESLAEALATKVNQLRGTFEQTKVKLREQEARAGKMQEELAAARHEAAELRSRSEALSLELDGARGNLETARKRMEELQRAATRLESERQALSQELNERKGTEPLHKSETTKSGLPTIQLIADELETRVITSADQAEQLASELEQERIRAAELDAARRAAQARADELTAERERLIGELAALRGAGQEVRAQGVEERLESTERALRDAAEARSDLQARLSQTSAERDRLAGELLRLKQEHEAASVEHRAALAAARRAQAEAAARNAELEVGLDSATSDRDRLAEELARGQRDSTNRFSAGESKLAEAIRRLTAEGERAERLARELDDARRAAAGAAARHEALCVELSEATSERQRLERQLAERESQAQTETGERLRLQEAIDRLREQLGREQARAIELDRRSADAREEARSAAGRHAQSAEAYAESVASSDRLASELAQARARHVTELAEAERRLQNERARQKELEAELAATHGTVAGLQARYAGLEQSLAASTSERDRLASQLAHAGQQRDGRDQAVADLARKLAEEQARHAIAQGELAAARKELEAAHGHRDGVATALATTSARHSTLAVEVERLTGELQRVLAEREAARVEHEAALHSVKRQLETERQRFAELTTRFSASQGEQAKAHDGAAALDARMVQAEAERVRALAEVERLRSELASAAAAAGQGRDAERLSRELGDLRRQLDARSDALIKAEAALQVEHENLLRIDAEREQLRQQVAAGIADRTALAEVTVARDRLATDLQRLQGDLERMRREDRSVELRATIERAEGQIASERSRITTLEAELGLARSQQQVAIASREGLENQLAKTVTDRERLLSEVDRLRHELDQVRGRLVTSNPDQAAELSVLKRLLAAEQDRVKELETKLIQAYREQGENSGLTDEVLRNRLTRASSRIRRLKERLREQRRKTETAMEELQRLKQARPAQGPASVRLPLAMQARAAKAQQAKAETEGLSGLRAAIFGESSAVNPAIGSGFTSQFGRPSVVLNPPAGIGEQSSRARAVQPPPRKIPKWVRYGSGVAGGALVLTFLALPRMFPISVQALVNVPVTAITAPIDGHLQDVPVLVGDPVLSGDRLAQIHNERIDTSTRDTMLAERARVDRELTASTLQLTRLEADLAGLEAEEAEARRQLAQRSLPVPNQPAIPPSSDANATALAQTIASLSQQIDALRHNLLSGSTASTLSLSPNATALRRKRLQERMAVLQADISILSGRLADMDGRLATENARIAALREAVLRAPHDGVVATRPVAPGARVAIGAKVVSIARSEQVFVEAIFPQEIALSVKPGDHIDLYLMSQNMRMAGTVRMVASPGMAIGTGSFADESTTLRERQFRLVIDIDGSSIPIQFGQNAKAMIVGDQSGLRGLAADLYRWWIF